MRETDTVKDYLDLVRKNRSSRFPVINQHQVVVGVVTMRDAGDKSPSTTIDKVMSRSLFLDWIIDKYCQCESTDDCRRL